MQWSLLLRSTEYERSPSTSLVLLTLLLKQLFPIRKWSHMAILLHLSSPIPGTHHLRHCLPTSSGETLAFPAKASLNFHPFTLPPITPSRRPPEVSVSRSLISWGSGSSVISFSFFLFLSLILLFYYLVYFLFVLRNLVYLTFYWNNLEWLRLIEVIWLKFLCLI